MVPPLQDKAGSRTLFKQSQCGCHFLIPFCPPFFSHCSGVVL